MDIIYRISHSTERKYIDLYTSLKTKLTDLEFFDVGNKASKKTDEREIQETIAEVYSLYHSLNTQSDSLEIDFKNVLTKSFPSKKPVFTSQKLFELIRVITAIDEQRKKNSQSASWN